MPFGLVAGASPVSHDLGGGAAVGLSVLVFAGASQLAAIDALASGGGAVVAAVAAWTINLRFLLYSASLAPHVAGERSRTRLWMAYLLTDQVYAVCISRWSHEGDDEVARRAPYFFGAAVTVWVCWQLSTVAGVLLGATLPEDVPLEFAVPLVFLVLLVPAVVGRAATVAAAVGGLAAVGAAELGLGSLSLTVGALCGIGAGTLTELRWPPSPPVVVAEPSG